MFTPGLKLSQGVLLPHLSFTHPTHDYPFIPTDSLSFDHYLYGCFPAHVEQTVVEMIQRVGSTEDEEVTFCAPWSHGQDSPRSCRLDSLCKWGICSLRLYPAKRLTASHYPLPQIPSRWNANV